MPAWVVISRTGLSPARVLGQDTASSAGETWVKGSNSHRQKTAVRGPADKAPIDLPEKLPEKLAEKLAAAPAWVRSALALAAALTVVLLVGSLWFYVLA